jgi:hypothetical protein
LEEFSDLFGQSSRAKLLVSYLGHAFDIHVVIEKFKWYPRVLLLVEDRTAFAEMESLNQRLVIFVQSKLTFFQITDLSRGKLFKFGISFAELNRIMIKKGLCCHRIYLKH